MPLAMHGVVAKKDGTLVNIVIGEDASDPVIGIFRPASSPQPRSDGQKGFRCYRR